MNRCYRIFASAAFALATLVPGFAQNVDPEPRDGEVQPQQEQEPETQPQTQTVTQKKKFNSELALTDIRFDIGILGSTAKDGGMAASLLQFTYSRKFWNRVVWRAGAQFASDACGYENLVGVPIGIGYRTGTLTFEEAATYAATGAVVDVVWDGLSGHPEQIGEDILANLLLLLFRRCEFYVGLTPGYYLGPASTDEAVDPLRRFSLTGDIGAVLSIPIWRFTVNLTPAYHYAFTKNYTYNGKAERHLFSATLGLGYMF